MMLAGSRRLAKAGDGRLMSQAGALCAALDQCLQIMPTSIMLRSAATQAAVTPSPAAYRANDPSLPLPRFLDAAEKHRPLPSPLIDALGYVKATARASFNESVDLALVLGTDPKRGDQAVRGTASLPHGTGRSVRVAVFAEGADAIAARDAGAEVVGSADLIDRIQQGGSGAIDFDKCLATPDMKSRLSKIARILGPRGLMPNAKLGTLVEDVAAGVRTLKQGRVEFRADRGAVVHVSIGKVSFSAEHLAANAGALIRAVLAVRPKGVKGSGASGFLLRANLSSTMGPGFGVSLLSLSQAAQTAAKAGR